MNRPLRAIVTAGGTREKVDDVRVITNLSRGRFGAAISAALAERGVDVTLIGSRELLSRPEWLDERLHTVPFSSFRDLSEALESCIGEAPPDLLFMVAAVSDYSPVPSQGKIRSTTDELVIRMRRNPKILAGLRERCGVTTFLVGFKLLSGVSEEELFSVAHAQARKGRLNLTVANDLQQFRPGWHPVLLVTPEGGRVRKQGSKDQVAAELVDFVLARHQVHWTRTVRDGDLDSTTGRAPAEALLEAAQSAGLLPGRDGNVTHRAPAGFWCTPRQVDKGRVSGAELLHVHLRDGEVHYRGGPKPSIDAAVHGVLYAAMPELDGLVHFHDALVLPTATTSFPYPCGTREEAEEVLAALAHAAVSGAWTGDAFCVKLVDHGYLLGVRGALDWDRIYKGWQAHLHGLGEPEVNPAQAVIANGVVVGVLAQLDAGDATLWLDPRHRGHGLGDDLAALLDDRGQAVRVHADCGVEAFYVERGWSVLGTEGPYTRLGPPSQHPDVIEAASVCLYDPVTQQVLLGERKVGPWPGYWSFPGGRREPGETLREAGLRELREETGLQPAQRQVFQELAVTVSGGKDQPVYRVTNQVVCVLSTPAPSDSDELSARWVSLPEASQLRPMASGTRRVIRTLRRRLGV